MFRANVLSALQHKWFCIPHTLCHTSLHSSFRSSPVLWLESVSAECLIHAASQVQVKHRHRMHLIERAEVQGTYILHCHQQAFLLVQVSAAESSISKSKSSESVSVCFFLPLRYLSTYASTSNRIFTGLMSPLLEWQI